MQKSGKGHPSGVTLLELVIAIGVAAMVISLGFMIFSEMTTGFWSQKGYVHQTGTMLVAKKRIENCLAGIEKVASCTEKSITCIKTDPDSLITIRYLNDSLVIGGKSVCGNLKKFKFELIGKDEPVKQQRTLLLWEAELEKGGWIGGAVDNSF